MVTKTIKFDPKHAGRIIGQRGNTIRGLQEELNVYMNVTKDNNSVS